MSRVTATTERVPGRLEGLFLSSANGHVRSQTDGLVQFAQADGVLQQDGLVRQSAADGLLRQPQADGLLCIAEADRRVPWFAEALRHAVSWFVETHS